MVIDGLRADMMRPTFTPELWSVASSSRYFANQRSVFPSATRVSSASIATGCYPSSHGLAGNAIALDEGGGLTAVSVGPPEFRERWRRATGRTLHRPTLSERLSRHGGVSIYSNSSAGAAHMQDPDGFGWLRHRNGSHGPGFDALLGEQHLDVTYDASGDQTTVDRFCDALESEPQHRLHMTWICEPDHSQHALELGSPEHLEILAGADRLAGRVARKVEELRAGGDDVLLIFASDHGHETIEEIVPVIDELVGAGLKDHRESNDVVIASSGMGALVYLADRAVDRRPAIAEWLRAQSWCAEVFAGPELTSANVPYRDHLHIAFAMAKRDEPNRFGIPGIGYVAADQFTKIDKPGRGQHGGLGPYETNPLLLVNGGSFVPGVSDVDSSTVNIAPTILRHLGIESDGMDGAALPFD